MDGRRHAMNDNTPRGAQHSAMVRAAIVGAVTLALALGLLVVFWMLARALALLFAAIVIASALAPATAWMEKRLPRPVAILFSFGAVVSVFAVVFWLVVPPLVDQAGQIASNLPELAEEAEARLERIDSLDYERLIDSIASSISDFSGALVALPMAVVSAAFELAMVFVMAIYWLITLPALRRYVLSLVPQARRERVSSVIAEIGQTMGGYVRGSVLSGLAVAALTYIGLVIIGIEYTLVLALIAGLGELIPILGPILAAIPALGIALLESPTQALIVLGFYVALQQVESHLIMPNILHSQAHIPPLLVIFALFAGGSIGGILGALIAVPIAGALRVLTLRIIAPSVSSWSGAEEPTSAQSRRETEGTSAQREARKVEQSPD